MLERLKRLFNRSQTEALEDLPEDEITSQQAIDPESARGQFVKSTLFNQIVPPFDLSKYYGRWLNDDLAFAIVMTNAYLAKSPIECKNENEDTCNFIRHFNRRIYLDFDLVFKALIDMGIAGFAAFEIVGNRRRLIDSTEIKGLFRIHPMTLVVVKTPQGRFDFFIQNPQLNSVTGQQFFFPNIQRRLDPQSIIFVSNYSPHTVYGHSDLQSIETRLDERAKLLSHATQSAENHSNPLLTAHYQMDQNREEDKKETRAQRRLLKKQAEKVDKSLSRWLVSGGTGSYDYGVLGHQSIPDLTPLVEYQTSAAIIAAGLNPQMMGYSMGPGFTSSESSNRQTIANIVSKQSNIVNQLQSKLYPMLKLIEDVPGDDEIRIQMEEPDLLSLKERYESSSVLLNVEDQKYRMGITNETDLAHAFGRDELADPERLREYIAGPSVDDMQNKNDPNGSQRVSSAIRSLNRGKKVSNNPSGNGRL